MANQANLAAKADWKALKETRLTNLFERFTAKAWVIVIEFVFQGDVRLEFNPWGMT